MKEIEIMSKGQPIKFIVDDEDYDFVMQWTWHYCHNYLVRREENMSISLHNEIYKRITNNEIPEGYIIDHINRNTLDNTRKNLRIATRTQNSKNKRKMKNNTSGYIGVCEGKSHGIMYWTARIINPIARKRKGKWFPYTENGKQHAAMWYDEKALEYFGEYCGELNFLNYKKVKKHAEE